MTHTPNLPSDIAATVAVALREDIGTGDITAQLIAEDTVATAHIISREPAVLCGVAWVNEVVRQVDPSIAIHWHVADGDAVAMNQTLVTLHGSARHLLTAERCALNFLQTLSGTATLSRHYAAMVKHTKVRLLDTRKTIPGLRTAQKYAVAVGGCSNHRMGLYDAFLIKENHIRACGSITAAVARARELHADKPVEIEVENLVQLREAMAANAEIIMLDNFALNAMREAVIINGSKAKLEASGGVNQNTLVAIAETGVDFISIGALTKDCKAIDLSMLFRNTQES